MEEMCRKVNVGINRTDNMDQTFPILEEYKTSSNKLYFLFGGIAAKMGMPPFEFYNSSKLIDENKIFFRDFSQSWYQGGLPGIGENIFDIGGFIERKINDAGPKEVYFVGNSMGGYAAILLASIVGKGRAIAFAPQTFISPEKRLKYSDKRWNEQIFQTYANTAHKRHVWDIKEVFPMNNKKIHIDIYVSKTDRLDYIHANELQGLENVNIYTFEVGGHALVRHFRDVGALPDILRGRYAQSAPADTDKLRR